MNKLSFIIAIIFVFLSSCGNTDEKNADKIVVTNPWIRQAPGNSDLTAGYMLISNYTNYDDKLINASSNCIDSIKLHTTYIDSKELVRMKMLNSLEIKSGMSVDLKPGGHHLMMEGFKCKINNKEIPIKLYFEKYGELTINAAIKKINEENVDHHKHH
ncbi:MAG: copper chaperone PCu(A)C [Candidatus Dadabacteria bacterium]|nr:copper chaperone PCu(A)C [Candidatus Dadabacteria bacterium]NIQ14849.1 copper chaperone PCu(A)C [Candidatus Dadabacteria bacterium]